MCKTRGSKNLNTGVGIENIGFMEVHKIQVSNHDDVHKSPASLVDKGLA